MSTKGFGLHSFKRDNVPLKQFMTITSLKHMIKTKSLLVTVATQVDLQYTNMFCCVLSPLTYDCLFRLSLYSPQDIT